MSLNKMTLTCNRVIVCDELFSVISACLYMKKMKQKNDGYRPSGGRSEYNIIVYIIVRPNHTFLLLKLAMVIQYRKNCARF